MVGRQPRPQRAPVFSGFGTCWARAACDCSQICNWKFLKDQQRSITRKCNLLNLRQINMYLGDNSPNPEPGGCPPIHCNRIQTCCNVIQTLPQLNSNNSILTRDKRSLGGMAAPGQIGGISTKTHGATAYPSTVGNLSLVNIVKIVRALNISACELLANIPWWPLRANLGNSLPQETYDVRMTYRGNALRLM